MYAPTEIRCDAAVCVSRRGCPESQGVQAPLPAIPRRSKEPRAHLRQPCVRGERLADVRRLAWRRTQSLRCRVYVLRCQLGVQQSSRRPSSPAVCLPSASVVATPTYALLWVHDGDRTARPGLGEAACASASSCAHCLPSDAPCCRTGRKSTVAPPKRGGSCAEPRSDRARSATQRGPRRPAQPAWRSASQAGQKPPSMTRRYLPAPRFSPRSGAATASLGRRPPRRLRRTPRTALSP
jgi:hypothetical protein